MNIPFILKETAANLQQVTFESWLESRVNEVDYKVISVISMTHTRWFLWFTGTFHRRNVFYTVQAVCAIALHLPYT